MAEGSEKIEEVFADVDSSEKGLTEEQVRERLDKYGMNELKETKKTTTKDVFVRQFKNFIIWVLIAAAFLSLLVEEVINFWVIMVITFIVVMLGFFQEYRAEKAMESLQKIVQPETTVVREGKPRNIKTKEIVPGDILVLESGDKISGDAVVFESVALRVDESALTGESHPVGKGKSEKIFAGTQVVHGKCRAVVVNTGMDTKLGQIAGLIQVKSEDTPLQKKIANLSRSLAILALVASLFTLVLGLVEGAPLEEMLLIAIALAVGAVPEGLPLTMTLTLAFGMRQMAHHKAIIRKMLAVETLGSTDIICTDKTGTLTRNEMTVEKIFVNENIIEVTGSGYAPKGEFLKDEQQFDVKQDPTVERLLQAIALCNNSSLEKRGDEWDVVGDPTEIALTVAAAKADFWKDDLEDSQPRTEEVTFTSERKQMTTVHEREGSLISFTKGAPETVLDGCDRMEISGESVSLNDEKRKHIMDKNMEFASSAYRVLGIAYREDPDMSSEDAIEQNMVFLGLVAMIDPPREEVKEAVSTSHKAGIKVVMITGDNQETAKAIGASIGLFDHRAECGIPAHVNVADEEKVRRIMEDCAVTGQELDELDDEEFEVLADHINIYARTMPEQKLRIVKTLQKNGHIVAMTGDGVNDAPALKKADIGIAMGIKGTDVSKESSVMVLQDDNFATIVEAVKRGRAIYDNIEKFTTYLISRNFTEVILILLGITLLGFELIPLLALQILFINMFSEIMPSIGLGLDPPEKGVMDRAPRDPKESILNRRNLVMMVSNAVVMASAAFLVFISSNPAENTQLARTLTFATVVSMILFVPFAFRSLEKSIFSRGFFTNRVMLGGVVVSFLLTLSAMYIPFLSEVFELVPLSLQQWLLPLGVAFCTMLAIEGVKAVTRGVK
ncbi:cation-translocating P-type ATPase [Methanolobus halotolerans]|uniref:Cation transporter n=1 Tax=Methanolobus halotolerans TaxID=2052935 RepID=A0A4E0R1J1_9EURY|nr:cation-transporting P-type ATPase [Methanolobus halotolerans]TGC11049.1 cation transporter [Methanolobus halotolerans]